MPVRELSISKRMNGYADSLRLTGLVASGEGAARNFITLSGYMAQFKQKLGYEPFPGTLNVLLDEASIPKRMHLNSWDQITIEGWEEDGRSFGAVHCFPVKFLVMSTEDIYDTIHAIYPDRTEHEPDTLELIAPISLREEFGLTDGERVSVKVEPR